MNTKMSGKNQFGSAEFRRESQDVELARAGRLVAQLPSGDWVVVDEEDNTRSAMSQIGIHATERELREKLQNHLEHLASR